VTKEVGDDEGRRLRRRKEDTMKKEENPEVRGLREVREA
jgi:hypothetical protein